MKAHFTSQTDNSISPETQEKASEVLSDMRGVGLSIDKLQQETDFLSYLKSLQAFSKRYTLLISVNDTPCGPAFTEEMARLMMDLGLEADLAKCYRYSYIAVIDAGKRIVEQATNQKVAHWEGTVGTCKIELTSVGYAVPCCQRPQIRVNGRDYNIHTRGINFVVLDSVTGIVLDACLFDTYATPIFCTHSIAAGSPQCSASLLLNYARKNPSINLICALKPAFPSDNLSEGEKKLIHDFLPFESCYNHLDCVPTLNQYFDSSSDILEVLTAPHSYHDIYGVRHFEDTTGKYVNTANGIRLTTNQLQKHKHSIFIVGGCASFGIGSSDSNTIASYLQRSFNNRASEYEFNVYNYGYYLWAGLHGNSSDDNYKVLDFLPTQPGDIVLFWTDEPSEGLPCCDLSKAAQRPHSYGEVFFDRYHYTADGNRLIADKLFDYLQQNDFFQDSSHMNSPQPALLPSQMPDGTSGNSNLQGLEEYKTILKNFYNSMFHTKIGAAVMNCNPFTLGHRYLIDQALKQCDYLMIFVVQEDKSVFSFDDRLKLVDDGTKDLENVAIIPSGNFVLSSLTFSEYFNKSKLQDRKVDTSLDVTLFAREIAPCLHISVRFAGEEPLDHITQQYNDSMRAILPQYGIDFVEIPRAEINGAPISASHVRKLLKEKDFAAISALVPETTLKYLQEHFQ